METKKECVRVSIYQASVKTLIDTGVWGTILDLDADKMVIPAKYYQQVFSGEVELDPKPDGQNLNILDRVFQVFYKKKPSGHSGRSFWVGDVVNMDGKFYVCKPVGFQECEFIEKRATHPRPELNQETIKRAEQVLIDNGIDPDETQTVLQVLGYILLNEELYPD